MREKLRGAIRAGSGRRGAAVLVVCLLIGMGLTASARTWLSSRTARAVSLPEPPVLEQQGAPKPVRGVIRLLTSGFNPAEVSGAGGSYRIVATRVSVGEEVRLQLKRQSGELVEELVMPQDRVDWTTLIELESGSYTISVANRPEWVCQITVQ